MSNSTTAAVKILSKEFQVTCPEGTETQLQEAALYLDNKMREIRSTGRVVGLERIAIMAALNIAGEFLAKQEQKEAYTQTVQTQLQKWQEAIDEALHKSDPIPPSSELEILPETC